MYKTNISILIENRNRHSLLLWDDHNARIFTEKAIDEKDNIQDQVSTDILDMHLLWDYIILVQAERITTLSWKDLIPIRTERTRSA